MCQDLQDTTCKDIELITAKKVTELYKHGPKVVGL